MNNQEGQSNPLPVMLYDGDCGFCQAWIERWRNITGGSILYFPYQQAKSRYPQVTVEECKEAVHLIMPDGRVFSGAHAVFHALGFAGKYSWLLWVYEHIPFFGRIAEAFYQWVAGHRNFLSKLFKKPAICRVK